ncbi:MAG: GIY-YIG nuclease family protein [bacterium]
MTNMFNCYVYIIEIGKNGTLYVGQTNNLRRRMIEHKKKLLKGFSQKYGVDKLVWFQQTNDIRNAIIREKQIKKWNRKWKIREIERDNPEWKDMFYEIGGSDELLDDYTNFEEL